MNFQALIIVYLVINLAINKVLINFLIVFSWCWYADALVILDAW